MLTEFLLSERKNRLRSFVAVIAVIAAVFFVYWQTVHFNFVALDDVGLVVRNTLVHSLNLRTLKGMFTSFDPELYIPLTLLSYHWDFLWSGSAPMSYHVTNVMLHALNALFVMSIVRKLSGSSFTGLFTGLLFAVHPINAEAVSWVSARKDLLSSFFFLASVHFNLLYRAKEDKDDKEYKDDNNSLSSLSSSFPSLSSFFRQKNILYALGLICFLLGLLSKVTVITLPFILLLIDWYHGRRDGKRMVIEKIPYLLLSIIFGLVAIVGKSGNLAQGPLSTYPLLAAKSAVFSLQKLLWPEHLSALYAQTTPVLFSSAEFWVPIALLLGLALSVAVLAFRNRIFLLGALFFLIALLPSFLTFSKNADLYFASDRYLYLPGIGVMILAASGVHWILNRLRTAGRDLMLLATLGIIVILGRSAYVQAQAWRDTPALFRHILAVDPHSALAHNNLGSHLMDERRYDEARREFQAAIDSDPYFILPRLNIANIFMNEGKREEAIRAYREAIEAIPVGPARRADDLIPYYFLAEIEEDRGNTTEALALLQEAATRGEYFAEPQFNVGLLNQKHGHLPEAIEAYQRAVDLNRRYTAAHYNLAAVLAETGRLEEAYEHLLIVLELDPTYEKAQEHANALRTMLKRD